MKRLQLIVLMCTIACMMCSCAWMNPLKIFKKSKPKVILKLPGGGESELNYRQTTTIVFVTKSTWQMVRTWLLDILIVTFLIGLFTSILGKRYPIPKPIISIGVAIIICMVMKWVTGGDLAYFGILIPACWALANGGYHIIFDVLKAKKITRSNFLSKKLFKRKSD